MNKHTPQSYPKENDRGETAWSWVSLSTQSVSVPTPAGKLCPVRCIWEHCAPQAQWAREVHTHTRCLLSVVRGSLRSGGQISPTVLRAAGRSLWASVCALGNQLRTCCLCTRHEVSTDSSVRRGRALCGWMQFSGRQKSSFFNRWSFLNKKAYQKLFSNATWTEENGFQCWMAACTLRVCVSTVLTDTPTSQTRKALAMSERWSSESSRSAITVTPT